MINLLAYINPFEDTKIHYLHDVYALYLLSLSCPCTVTNCCCHVMKYLLRVRDQIVRILGRLIMEDQSNAVSKYSIYTTSDYDLDL